MKIKSFDQFSEISEKKKPLYEYGCMMVYFDFPEMKSIHEKLEKEDLYEGEKDDSRSYGLEKEPHVTLLYGLHSDEIDDDEVMSAVDKSAFRNLKLHNVSAFTNPKYDVLKFDVKGEGLHENNENLKKFPFTSDFPDYHPHSTIAYLKPGTSKKYIEMFKEDEYEIAPSELVYSKPGEDNKIVEKF